MGWNSVAEGLARISSKELTEWMAFASREPIGDARADLQAAIIAQVVANVNRGEKQDPFEVDQFLPDFWEDDDGPEQSVEEQRFLIEQMRAVFAGWQD